MHPGRLPVTAGSKSAHIGFMTNTPADIPQLSGDIMAGAPTSRNVRPHLAVAPAPKPAEPSPAAPAEAVAHLNAMQLSAAHLFLFRLRHNHGDTVIIDRVAAEHPGKMAEANALTEKVLGTPEQWQARAVKDWTESDWSLESSRDGDALGRIWNGVVSIGPLLVAGIVTALGGNLLIGLGAGAASAALIFKLFARPANVGVPELYLSDVKQLFSFVAEAVLANLLEAEGKLAPVDAPALRRGLEHLTFIGNTTTAMAVPPFEFKLAADNRDAAAA